LLSQGCVLHLDVDGLLNRRNKVAVAVEQGGGNGQNVQIPAIDLPELDMPGVDAAQNRDLGVSIADLVISGKQFDREFAEFFGLEYRLFDLSPGVLFGVGRLPRREISLARLDIETHLGIGL